MFKELNDTPVNPETILMAQSYLRQIYFLFSCILVTWNRILNHTDKLNRELQSENVRQLQT
jgi:hypothetical protein